MTNPANRSKVRSIDPLGDIGSFLSQKLIGQPAAIAAIIPYIQVYRATLSPEGRPAGIFLLLGPTGTGKTRTVEALAEVLHGQAKKMLKVDCGEFQMDHEVAKLIGAPPGYLGHRETQPWLTQQKVNAASSEACDVSLVLFDEVEKAAPSMTRLLLGILDKAALRLGDGTTVNFEKTFIFLTSNLGAQLMAKELNPDFGFESLRPKDESDQKHKLESIGMRAVRKQFSPEFVNRIDVVVTYQPLGSEALTAILDLEVRQLQNHLDRRLGERTFHLELPPRARRFLIERGTSKEYGARELKRTMQRQLVQPLACMLTAGEIAPGTRVRADVNARKDKLVLRDVDAEERLPA
jgi:ATP-dependent Clp protease ATP-binding subunit ClpA